MMGLLSLGYIVALVIACRKDRLESRMVSEFFIFLKKLFEFEGQIVIIVKVKITKVNEFLSIGVHTNKACTYIFQLKYLPVMAEDENCYKYRVTMFMKSRTRGQCPTKFQLTIEGDTSKCEFSLVNNEPQVGIYCFEFRLL